ncbi:MAG: helix-turn-helix domain-containing protein [Armatimonadetes bacterium]|nr:helix-turn-helix domain-containing protein [Armatimonadota bacterium]
MTDSSYSKMTDDELMSAATGACNLQADQAARLSQVLATRLMQANHPRWLLLGEAARMLDLSPTGLRWLCDVGRVPSFRTPGGVRLFREHEIERYRAQRAEAGQVSQSEKKKADHDDQADLDPSKVRDRPVEDPQTDNGEGQEKAGEALVHRVDREGDEARPDPRDDVGNLDLLGR